MTGNQLVEKCSSLHTSKKKENYCPILFPVQPPVTTNKNIAGNGNEYPQQITPIQLTFKILCHARTSTTRFDRQKVKSKH